MAELAADVLDVYVFLEKERGSGVTEVMGAYFGNGGIGMGFVVAFDHFLDALIDI